MRRLLLWGLPLVASLSAQAQTARESQPLVLLPNAQGELALKNGDYLLLNVGVMHYTKNNNGNQSFAAVAYEHFWNPNWSWGGRVQATRYTSNSAVVAPEVLLRHRSALGPLTFGQRLDVERFLYTNKYMSDYNQNWVRLRLDLEKTFPLGGADVATGLAVRPRVSFEAATHLRFQKNDNDPSERFIQYTSLRAEVGVRISPQFDFTPWFAYGTNYLVTVPQYDGRGNQTSGGNLNVRSPMLGLDARFTFGPGLGASSRQQLPTQH